MFTMPNSVPLRTANGHSPVQKRCLAHGTDWCDQQLRDEEEAGFQRWTKEAEALLDELLDDEEQHIGPGAPARAPQTGRAPPAAGRVCRTVPGGPWTVEARARLGNRAGSPRRRRPGGGWFSGGAPGRAVRPRASMASRVVHTRDTGFLWGC